MLWKASSINGYAVAASDGRIGTVSDFLFDDSSWRVRWLVVDTGNWLSGRKVLLPPSALGHLDRTAREFAVELTMLQVKDSPEIDTDQPVSRRMENNTYLYYGWGPYWGNDDLYMGSMGGLGDMGGDMVGTRPALSSPESSPRKEAFADTRPNDGDPHLRSIEAVTGYHIHASDGEVGHVEDFLIEDAGWSIRYLIVDTKNWWPGNKVLISPLSIQAIDWMDRSVNLAVERQRVKDSPGYDPSATVDRAYETHLEEHYGHVRPNP